MVTHALGLDIVLGNNYQRQSRKQKTGMQSNTKKEAGPIFFQRKLKLDFAITDNNLRAK